MKLLNCIIVDDDEIDRLVVTSFAKQHSNLNIVGIFERSEDALAILDTENIDVAFLDIDMPGLNGIEFRKKAHQIPVCIFVTSHPEFAVESFELDTLDFIVKPIKFDRFNQAMERVNEYMELKQKAELFESSIGGDVIYIKEGHQETKIKLHEILYLEALKDYTKIVTANKRHCVLASLGTLLKENHFGTFIRIHRSYAIQKQFIKTILSNDVLMNNNLILPIGRSYKDNLVSL